MSLDRNTPDIWHQIVIDRREHISPFRQIANSIRHKIATHQLPANTPLPSVRKLADHVGVTPATVARAYRHLQSDGLVESQVGVGTVVSDTQRLVFHAQLRSTAELDAAVDEAVTPLLAKGYTPADVRDAVARRLALPASPQYAIVVSDAPTILEKYTGILARELEPLGIRVEGVMLAELRRCSAATRAKLADASRVMTALGLLRPVREALEACGVRVPVSVIFTELKWSVIERLGAIPKDAKALIVAEERYRNSILGILREYLPVENITISRRLEGKAIRRDLKDRTVVVHSLGTRDMVRDQIDDRHDAILMDYQVRRDAMAKLRESFAPEAIGASARMEHDGKKHVG